MILGGDAFWIMVGIFSLVFVMMGAESRVYEKMARESEDMQHTGLQVFKQIKMKYESLCRIGRNVNNTRNFVDKIMFSRKVCGIRADVFNRMEKVLALGCIYMGITCSMYVYFRQGINNQWMIYGGGGLLMWLALRIWEITLDINYKKERISVFVTDYLENQMYAAVFPSNSVVHKEAAAASEKRKPGNRKKEADKPEKINHDVYNEKLIEEVLDEFLM